MTRRPIGVFDSGLGGLTILKTLMRELPAEDMVYFGDTARVPYGTKSRDTVVKFSIQNVEFLLQYGVKLIVVACHTSSAWALNTLRRYFRVPMVGVIVPGAEAALAQSRSKRIGVIGTASTMRSGAYEHVLHRLDRRAQVVSQSCPLLVSLAEEGWTNDSVCRDVVQYYLGPVMQRRIDTLLLGCTHYPLLRRTIQRIVGRRVCVVDAGRRTAGTVRTLLEQSDELRQTGRPGRLSFYVSDEAERFSRVGSFFLGQPIRRVCHGGPA